MRAALVDEWLVAMLIASDSKSISAVWAGAYILICIHRLKCGLSGVRAVRHDASLVVL